MHSLTTFIGKVIGSQNPGQNSTWSNVYVYEPTIEKVKQARGNLYLVLEMPSEYEELGTKLIDIVQEHYYRDLKKDLLESLEVALSKANEKIEEYNRKLISEKQETLRRINIACGVLCDQTLHIAQIGDFYTYLVRRGRLNRISNVSQDDHKTQSFQNIASGQIELGDILTLTSAKISDVLPLSQLKEIITSCYPSVAASRITDLIHKKNDPRVNPAAIILEVNADYEQQENEYQSTAFSQKLKQEKDQIAQTISGDVDSKKNVANMSVSIDKEEVASVSSSESFEQETPAPVTHLHHEVQDEEEETDVVDQVLQNDDEYYWQGQEEEKTNLLGRLTTQAKDYFQLVGNVIRGKEEVSKLKNVFLVAGVILFVVIAISLLTNPSTEAAPPVEETRLHADAWDNYNKAREALRVNDFINAKEYLLAANVTATEAIAISEDQAKITELTNLQTEIQTELDQIDGITRLNEIVPAADIAEVLPTAVPTSFHNTSDALYIFDATNQQIYRYAKANDQLNSSQESFIPAGSDGIIQYATSSGENIYLYSLISQQPRMLRFNPQTGSLNEVAVTFEGQWQATNSITTWTDSGGNTRLYLLDPTQNAFWRYRPSGDQYSIPTNFFNAADALPEIQEVIDSEIDNDVYFLTSSNQIIKFLNGDRDTEFSLKGLKEPLTQVAAMSMQNLQEDPNSPIGQRIYLADSGSNQIHIFSKSDGLLVRTYASDVAFTDLKDLYADEAASILYVLDGTKIYKLPL